MNKSILTGYCEIKYLLISPSKLRKIVESSNQKNASKLLLYYNALPQRGATLLSKALKSAISNAVNKNKCNPDDLNIEFLVIEEGSRLKRFKARARGRSTSIVRRTSHIKIGLNIINGVDNGSKN